MPDENVTRTEYISASLKRGLDEPEDDALAAVPVRVREMYALYEEGGTLREVGRQFGVSQERVRQLLRHYDLPTRSVRAAAQLQREAHLRRANEIVEAFMDLRDPSAVARKLKLPLKLVQDVVRERIPARDRRKPAWIKKKYSDAELISCLRQASTELGGVLTTKAYTELAAKRRLADGRRWPTHQTHFHRFGSWRAALQAAGLRANRSSPIAGQRIFDVGHCLDAVRHVHRELGRVPSAQDYERIASESGGALPSLATLRNRCGSWLEALRMAGL